MKISVKYIGHLQFVPVAVSQPKWLETFGRGWSKQ